MATSTVTSGITTTSRSSSSATGSTAPPAPQDRPVRTALPDQQAPVDRLAQQDRTAHPAHQEPQEPTEPPEHRVSPDRLDRLALKDARRRRVPAGASSPGR